MAGEREWQPKGPGPGAGTSESGCAGVFGPVRVLLVGHPHGTVQASLGA